MNKVKKGFTIEYHLINGVLMEWNPLSVDGPALREEYIRYIPEILNLKGDRKKIINFLEDVLLNKMQVDYDPSDAFHKREIMEITAKLSDI